MQNDATADHFESDHLVRRNVERRYAQRAASDVAAVSPTSEATFPSAELTIVVPTYSERGNVREVARRIAAALDGVKWEIVFVDDDSPDGTAEVVKSLARGDSRVRCIRRVRRGLSGACVEGILSSSAPIVAVMDADLQHDEAILPQMLHAIRNGAELAVATRYSQGGSATGGFSPVRRWGSEMATRLANTIIGTKVSDPMSGFS